MFSRTLLQKVLIGLAVFLLFTASLTVPAPRAATLAGERVTIIVPFDPGGGSDTWVRFLSPYYHQYLPGKPSIIVRNVPGAGSIKGANMLEDVKKDGKTLLCVSTSTVMNYIMQDKRVKFKPEKWIPVMNAPLGCVVYGRTDLGLTGNAVEDIKMLQKKQVIFGGNSPTSGELPRILSMAMLGLDVKPVFGLNRGPVRLAFERGEFTINYDTMSAYLQETMDLVKSGVVTPLYSFGVWDPKKKQMVRDPSVPDMPHFVEVYEGVYGKKPSGAAWKAFFTLLSVSVMHSKALVLPGGTPDDIVEMYQKAGEDLIKDPKYLKQAPQMTGDYEPNLREDAKDNLMNAISMDDEARTWLWDWLGKNFGVKKD